MPNARVETPTPPSPERRDVWPWVRAAGELAAPAVVPDPAGAGRLILRDPYGRRWRVSDVRASERPAKRRPPPDPAATHRCFESHDGARAFLWRKGPCWRSIREHVGAAAMEGAEALAQQMGCAVRGTYGCRRRLEQLGTPWRPHGALVAHY